MFRHAALINEQARPRLRSGCQQREYLDQRLCPSGPHRN